MFEPVHSTVLEYFLYLGELLIVELVDPRLGMYLSKLSVLTEDEIHETHTFLANS